MYPAFREQLLAGQAERRGTFAGLEHQRQDAHADQVQAITAMEGTSPDLLMKLQSAAEQCCVVQQTLKAPPKVNTVFVQEAHAPRIV